MPRFALAAVAFVTLVAASAHVRAQTARAPQNPQIPIAGTTSTGDMFAGTLTLQRFSTNSATATTGATGGAVLAVGTLAGSITNANGQVSATGLQTIALPVQTSGGSQTTAVPGTTANCALLHLETAPATVTALGTPVNVSRVVIDIGATADNTTLSTLLCNVPGALNNPATLAPLLNQVLAALSAL